MMNNVVFMLNAAGDKVSSLPEALAVAGFTIAVVFAILILIYFCIVFFSKLINISNCLSSVFTTFKKQTDLNRFYWDQFIIVFIRILGQG